MKKRPSAELIASVIATLLGIAVIAAEIYFRQEERPFWEWSGILVLAVMIISVIAYRFVESRRCIIARNFKEYCVRCEKMLKKSRRHGHVMTIQTPIEPIPTYAKGAYESYMEKTFEMLITASCQYNRLVVLEVGRIVPETRIKEFVNDLVSAAKEREHSHKRDKFDLRNVHVGFVSSDSVQDLIYSNVDIHCTTRKDFSIAFMGREAAKGINFGSSLHLHDSRTTLSELIRKDFEAAWNYAITTASVITIGDHYPNYTASKYEQKDDAKLTEIKQKINSEIDRMVNLLKSNQCPCPARGGQPNAFAARIKLLNPTWAVALQQELNQVQAGL